MSDLLDIAQKLNETQKALKDLEQAIADNPGALSLLASAVSLRERQGDLEIAFAEEANRQHIDVCSYRLFSEHEDKPPIAALTGALSSFQAWFTTVFDAIKNGPKQRSKVEVDVVKSTEFGFGYAFTGSVGFVMTMPNERLLIGDSQLDQAMETVFKMAKADDSERIAFFSKELGPASVRKMYWWTTEHLSAGLGAEIEWRRQDSVKARLFIQTAELDSLKKAIEETSDETEETIEAIAELVGADIPRHIFHLKIPGAGDVRGTMAESIGESVTVELPKHYKATFRKTTRINYSTEKEDIEYHLLKLDPVSGQ
jgi:hypothetical protein